MNVVSHKVSSHAYRAISIVRMSSLRLIWDFLYLPSNVLTGGGVESRSDVGGVSGVGAGAGTGSGAGGVTVGGGVGVGSGGGVGLSHFSRSTLYVSPLSHFLQCLFLSSFLELHLQFSFSWLFSE